MQNKKNGSNSSNSFKKVSPKLSIRIGNFEADEKHNSEGKLIELKSPIHYELAKQAEFDSADS